MSFAGGCMCGAVRFRLDAEPLRVGWCHCTSCRRHTGAPAAVFVDCLKKDVTFTKGRPAFFASSQKVRRGFCAACGSTLSFEHDDDRDEIHLHVGAFDRADLFAPNTEATHTNEKLPWFPQG
ncbi:MAG: GFA family protein [Hyphomonadaceae bacterium]|nr:GFA family protein [Hyphomonadaceae bacterium]